MRQWAMGNGQWAMGNGGIEAMRVMLALQHCGIPALPNCPIAQLPNCLILQRAVEELRRAHASGACLRPGLGRAE